MRPRGGMSRREEVYLGCLVSGDAEQAAELAICPPAMALGTDDPVPDTPERALWIARARWFESRIG